LRGGAAVALIGVSVWGFHLANEGLPRQLAFALLGPPAPRSEGGHSAPTYLECDIATMLLMVLTGAGSGLYLVVRVVRWLLARRRAASSA
jgi:hypothetical protein